MFRSESDIRDKLIKAFDDLFRRFSNNNNIKFTSNQAEMGSMTRRERLTATLKGEAVDRPAVNFYEIGGFLVNPDDPDEYNIYNSPSWRPLLDLAENQTDIIRLVSPVRAQSHLSWDGSYKCRNKKPVCKGKSMGGE